MAPHESVIYTWEEPLKPHKLDLRVGLKRKAVSATTTSPPPYPLSGDYHSSMLSRHHGVTHAFTAMRLCLLVAHLRQAKEESGRRGFLLRRGVPYEFNANQSAVRIRLDEIGFQESIPVQVRMG